jgi:hypothetical protein
MCWNTLGDPMVEIHSIEGDAVNKLYVWGRMSPTKNGDAVRW